MAKLDEFLTDRIPSLESLRYAAEWNNLRSAISDKRMALMKAFGESLEYISEPGITVSAEVLGITHCVYMFVKDETVLYVGSSGNGLCRPFDSQHNARAARKESTDIHIWKCGSKGEAMKTEAHLIKKLRPKYNRQRVKA